MNRTVVKSRIQVRIPHYHPWTHLRLNTLTDRLKSWPLYVLPHHLLSRIVFKLTRIEGRLVPTIIKIFVRLFNVELDEATHASPNSYKSFNEFFTRTLKDDARPLHTGDLVCPVDGRVSQLGPIESGTIVQAKNHSYQLAELLGGRVEDCTPFVNGRFATLYLSPRDYHRIHMPVTGKLCSMHYIPGRLFSVAPHTVRVVPRLFARNERVVALFDTSAGKMAMVLVGAINVAAIETVWEGLITPPVRPEIVYKDYESDFLTLEKGTEMGRFNMGSTVIVLLERGGLHSDLNPGDPVRMGQSFGHL